MGYFYNKFLEAAVQTDDEIGNDLKQIEDDIEGKNGIEAHAEEIEDALDGMVGDLVDECMIMIAESEYNWNLMMKEAGLAELLEYGNNLNESDTGKESFKDKIIRWIQTMKEKIVELFNKFFARFDKMDVLSLYNKKKDSIERGYKSGNYKFESYSTGSLAQIIQACNDSCYAIRNSINGIKNGNSDKYKDMKDLIKAATGLEADDIPSMIKIIDNNAFEKITYDPNGKGTYIIDLENLKTYNGLYRTLKSKNNRLLKEITNSYDRLADDLKNNNIDKYNEKIDVIKNCINLSTALLGESSKLTMILYTTINRIYNILASIDPGKGNDQKEDNQKKNK